MQKKVSNHKNKIVIPHFVLVLTLGKIVLFTSSVSIKGGC